MPCNSAPYPEYSRHDLDALELYMQTQIDRVTRVASEAMKLIRKNGLFDDLGEEAKGWSYQRIEFTESNYHIEQYLS